MRILRTIALIALLFIIGNAGELEVKLAEAAGHGNIEQIEALLKKGAEIDFQHENTDTALDYALDNGQLKAAEFLLQKGAKRNLIDKNKNCAFFLSAKMDELNTMKLLHSYGGKFVSSEDGTHPIHQATRHNNIDMIDFLLENGHANINDCIYDTKKKIFYNPLMQAMGLDTEKDDPLYGFPNYNLIRHLFEKNASINAKCANKTPLEMAKELGDTNLISELNDHSDIPIRKRIQQWIVANYPQRHNGKTVIEATSDQCTINYYPLGIYLPGIKLNFSDSNKHYKIEKEEIIPGIDTEDRFEMPTVSIPIINTKDAFVNVIDKCDWIDGTDRCTYNKVASKIEKKVADIRLPVDLHLKKATEYKQILEDYVHLCSSDKNISDKAEKRSRAMEYSMEAYQRWTPIDSIEFQELNENFQISFTTSKATTCGTEPGQSSLDPDDPFVAEILNKVITDKGYNNASKQMKKMFEADMFKMIDNTKEAVSLEWAETMAHQAKEQAILYAFLKIGGGVIVEANITKSTANLYDDIDSWKENTKKMLEPMATRICEEDPDACESLGISLQQDIDRFQYRVKKKIVKGMKKYRAWQSVRKARAVIKKFNEMKIVKIGKDLSHGYDNAFAPIKNHELPRKVIDALDKALAAEDYWEGIGLLIKMQDGLNDIELKDEMMKKVVMGSVCSYDIYSTLYEERLTAFRGVLKDLADFTALSAKMLCEMQFKTFELIGFEGCDANNDDEGN